MNFLAHCLIGARAQAHTDSDDTGLIAGGFLGDFIKGPVPEVMPAELQLGVRLHRRIDAFSNQHPDIRTSCDRFPPELRRIAPILVDILCDHLLTRSWSGFHAESLPQFTATTYAAVAQHHDWLPARGHRFFSYAKKNDLFASYGEWQVISDAMHSITRRLGKSELNPLMDEAIPPLLDALETDFRRYFPAILDHAVDWVASPENRS